ncbi:2-acylglycerophosphoethanolamine acyltransferase (plasmid) [Legionella adelaidensis]|uniref:2-acylglycerophosphoethanolamine acyltransferase n=1 Tax=Legionella adelaidensis TaxID=45056 RepID=A0A0W0R1Q0_9GAMM|nr:MFS transporter [Legionella adelaidensis]KTC64907.1 2-acylglycerophosphoethanolamine acyltransferase [Legionella adelaidensis]VEH85590.1 2-acylglycerophosphoethanolamine acyltransferase [Legionella adelaidensis]
MAAPLFYLLQKKKFLPLFLTQFFGAFNDNAFKMSMLTLISYHLSSSQIQSENYQAIASGLFILPFFLFSGTAGQLADKYDKAVLTRIIKLLEIVLTTLGGLSLYSGNITLMMITLTGMGIHSTFFGPVKYAILPDHLPKTELLGATALIESSTFIAILLGTTLGTLSIAGTGERAFNAILLIICIAVVGFIASCFIPPTTSHTHNLQIVWNPWRATRRMLREVGKQAKIVPVVFGISWFWLVGGVILTKLPDYANYVLHAQSTIFALFLALFSIGIAVGSLFINYVLKGAITLKYTPHAMLILSFFIIDLYFATPTNVPQEPQSFLVFFHLWANIRVVIDFFLAAVCCGVFLVPFYTYLQVLTEGHLRARCIATNNITNAFFMVIGTLLVMFFLYLNISIIGVFLILGILNILAALLLAYLL